MEYSKRETNQMTKVDSFMNNIYYKIIKKNVRSTYLFCSELRILIHIKKIFKKYYFFPSNEAEKFRK